MTSWTFARGALLLTLPLVMGACAGATVSVGVGVAYPGVGMGYPYPGGYWPGTPVGGVWVGGPVYP